MSDLFWLTDEQMARLQPYFPKSRGRERVDDRRVLSGINRQFHASAPNMLWVSVFTYVATWSGFIYVAFVIDGYAR